MVIGSAPAESNQRPMNTSFGADLAQSPVTPAVANPQKLSYGEHGLDVDRRAPAGRSRESVARYRLERWEQRQVEASNCDM